VQKSHRNRGFRLTGNRLPAPNNSAIVASENLRPFNPADAGTPEKEWLALLQGAQEWSPRRGPLLVVAPHPDDEVLGAGGLIQSWAAAGQPVSILSVTDGEAADSGWQGLDRIRRKELQEALRTLAPIHVSVQRTAIPGGKVVDHANKLRGVLTERATSDATIVAPYEQDGHPDHAVVGRVCREVARASGVPLVSYPVWAWHHTQPRSVRSLRWVRFSLSAAARRSKARALLCFKSQLRPPSAAAIVPPHLLACFQRPYEAFVL
jgi:LmbE family N-acetylglucosaminyl deacetylase